MNSPLVTNDHSCLTLDDILHGQAQVIRPRDISRWMSAREIMRKVRARQWQRAYRGVYVAHNADLTWEQERWVCLLAAPDGSALGGLTAAELDGLRGFAVPETYVVVPAGYRRPLRQGLIAKLSHHVGNEDVHPTRTPRRTRLPRSIVDAASWASQDRHARAIVLAGVQQRLVRCRDLRAALNRRGPCRRHALITESIDDAEGGVASVPEHDFDQIRRSYDLPEPKRQAIMNRSDGRYYLDADWPAFGVSAEIHGTQHLEIVSWDADLDRQSVIAAGGRRVLQFTSYSIRHRKDRVGSLLTDALRNGGWHD